MLLSLARSSIRVSVVLGVWMLLACVSANAQTAVEATSGNEGPPSAPFVSAEWVAPTGEFHIDRPLPLVRREFTLASRPGKATLRIVGL